MAVVCTAVSSPFRFKKKKTVDYFQMTTTLVGRGTHAFLLACLLACLPRCRAAGLAPRLLPPPPPLVPFSWQRGEGLPGRGVARSSLVLFFVFLAA